MADETRFIWHGKARLFAGSSPVAATRAVRHAALRVIPPRPTEACLAQLGAQIDASQPFCISGTDIPDTGKVPDTHFLTLTGGSTGRPKAILRSQSSWIKSFDVNAATFGLTPADNVAVLGTLDHSLALYGVLEGLHLGCGVHALDSLSPGKQIQACIARRISVLYATPTQLKSLTMAAKGRILPDMRLVLCGGGALDGRARAAIPGLVPNAGLHVFYGSAETSFVSIGTTTTPDGSSGTPYPGVQIKVCDAAGQPTPGVGEVWVRSPYLFDRYLHADSPDTRWRDGYLSVGELGLLDNNGNLWIKGRKTRMVTIADQNVFPEAVEAFVAGQPGVPDAAVLAQSDALRGHHLIAVIEGAKNADMEDMIQHACRAEFGPLIAPKAILFIPKLPRIASGKVDYAALARMIGQDR